MARSKGPKAETETTNEGEAVSTTETTEAPASPAPTADKPVIDHEGNLFTAITAFASDSDVAALQEAYRAVPAAARGKVQGVAMKRAMTEGGVDMDVLGAVLDAFNNLPAATKSRTTKPALDEATVAAIQLAGIMVGYESAKQRLGDEAHATAAEWFANGAPEEHVTAVTKVAANVDNASQKGGSGGGTRTRLTEKLSDLIARSAISAGAELKGANDVTAQVNPDGTVTTKGETFDNLSAAAKVHRVGEDGKQTSTNGWDFWQFEGKPVGELRKS